MPAHPFTDIETPLASVVGITREQTGNNQELESDIFVADAVYQNSRHITNTTPYRSRPVIEDTLNSPSNQGYGIFFYSAKVLQLPKRIYYYVYASCFCNLNADGKKNYHVFFSPIKRQSVQYELQRKFNKIIHQKYRQWSQINQGEIIENGFPTYQKAKVSKNIAIHAYESNGFKVQELKW